VDFKRKGNLKESLNLGIKEKNTTRIGFIKSFSKEFEEKYDLTKINVYGDEIRTRSPSSPLYFLILEFVLDIYKFATRNQRKQILEKIKEWIKYKTYYNWHSYNYYPNDTQLYIKITLNNTTKYKRLHT